MVVAMKNKISSEGELSAHEKGVIINEMLAKIKGNRLPTKKTAVLNAVALSYNKVRGIYFLAVVFTVTI